MASRLSIETHGLGKPHCKRNLHVVVCSTIWETHITMENTNFKSVNQLFLWQCSIAMLNCQRVIHIPLEMAIYS